MINKKFLCSFLTLLVLVVRSPIAYAEDLSEEVGYVDLKAGEPAPTDGLLFDPPALSKLIANQQTKLNLLVLEKETEISKIKLDLETAVKKKEAEIKVNKELSEDLIKIKQERIEQLSKELKWNNLYFVGGFTVGVVISIVIFYAAVQVPQ